MPALYNIVNNTPTWCYHRMAPGATMAGEAPRTAAANEANTFPAVKAGLANFASLTKGGLFTLVANSKRPLVVEAVDNPGSATVKLIDRNAPAVERAMPSSVPFCIGPNEVIKATGGGAGGSIGFLYRIQGEKIL
jgi:hypothetical protein